MPTWGVSLLQRLRKQARPVFERAHPEHPWALNLILKPVINIHPLALASDTLPVGNSKVGGLPDLRPDSWPLDDADPMVFVAQFNLAELKAFDEDDLLPDTGLLSFFMGQRAIEQVQMQPTHWQVRYEPELDGLSRVQLPASGGAALEYATSAHSLTFEAGVHPWGDVGLWQPDGTRQSLLYDHLWKDPEWKKLTTVPEPSGEFFLLGDSAVVGLGLDEEDGEVLLLGLPCTSKVLSVVNPDMSLSFAFLLPRADLARREFSNVRLTYDMS